MSFARAFPLGGLVNPNSVVGKQQLHHGVVAIERGTGDCRAAILIGEVGVHAAVGKQQRHHRGVPFDSGKYECRVANLVPV